MALRKKKQLGGLTGPNVPATKKNKDAIIGKPVPMPTIKGKGKGNGKRPVPMPTLKGEKGSTNPPTSPKKGAFTNFQNGGALNTSTYNKSNKGIQDNITKGGVNKRRGEMINADEELKDDRNNKKPRLTKVKKVKLKKKIVSKIPNIYQSGGFLEPGTESID